MASEATAPAEHGPADPCAGVAPGLGTAEGAACGVWRVACGVRCLCTRVQNNSLLAWSWQNEHVRPEAAEPTFQTLTRQTLTRDAREVTQVNEEHLRVRPARPRLLPGPCTAPASGEEPERRTGPLHAAGVGPNPWLRLRNVYQPRPRVTV